MREKVILFIKGFFMGIANIIPGVSGGTLAITMGIYERLIGVISHFKKNFKKDFSFLLTVGIGAIAAILLGSKLCIYALDKFPLQTIFFFTGLILGGIPMLYRKVKGKLNVSNILVFVITFIFVIGIGFLNTGNDVNFSNMNILNYVMLFVIGVIAAATMVIPGISGSFMLMVMGYYKPILNTINNLTSFNDIGHSILVLLPFGLGIVFGIVIISKILEYLFKKFEVSTYCAVLGFVLSSIIGIFLSAEGLVFTFGTISISLITLLLGFLLAYKLGEK